jgi:hypothetical protein
MPKNFLGYLEFVTHDWRIYEKPNTFLFGVDAKKDTRIEQTYYDVEMSILSAIDSFCFCRAIATISSKITLYFGSFNDYAFFKSIQHCHSCR